jgi:hypothetical protein
MVQKIFYLFWKYCENWQDKKNCLQYGTKVVNGMELERIPDNVRTVLKEIKCEKMLMSEKTCFIICISSKVTHKLT